MAADGHFVRVTGAFRRRPARAVAGTGTRLPWWALVLPALAFAALLTLTASGGHAAADASPLTGLLAHLREVLPPSLSTPR
jgi:hypothetical protein